MLNKVAVTLYSVRDYCKTEADLDSTLKKITEIGYKAIQVSAVPLDPEQVKTAADKYNLKICASHENLDTLRNDFDSIVKKLKTWNCDFTALGHPGDALQPNQEQADKLISELNAYALRFSKEGIRFGYHNHHTEFIRIGESLFLEQLYEKTDHQKFCAEIDVHWVQRGGQNPADWIRKVDGRMPVCHFKDFAILKEEPIFCEVGEGNLDWPSILQACRETSVEWYVVEQDTPVPDRDIFKSLEISFNNLNRMGIK